MKLEKIKEILPHIESVVGELSQEDKNECLYVAACVGDIKAARILVANGADVEAPTDIWFYRSSTHECHFSRMEKGNPSYNTATYRAFFSNLSDRTKLKEEVALFLLDNSKKPHNHFRMAAQIGCLDAIKLIHSKTHMSLRDLISLTEAHPNSFFDSRKNDVLLDLVQGGYAEILQYFAENGAIDWNKQYTEQIMVDSNFEEIAGTSPRKLVDILKDVVEKYPENYRMAELLDRALGRYREPMIGHIAEAVVPVVQTAHVVTVEKMMVAHVAPLSTDARKYIGEKISYLQGKLDGCVPGQDRYTKIQKKIESLRKIDTNEAFDAFAKSKRAEWQDKAKHAVDALDMGKMTKYAQKISEIQRVL